MARTLERLRVTFEGSFDVNGTWKWSVAEHSGEVSAPGEIPTRFQNVMTITDLSEVQSFLDMCRSECKTECNAS